jgi:beta-galactosidase
LPYWLATKYPGIKLRTSDEDYLREIEKWYSILMPKLVNHFYGNGGNIIMVQIENEYGAYSACDQAYMEFLRDETKKYTQDSAVLFTVDWPYDKEITCGSVKDVFITVDFGRSTFEEVLQKFAKLREYQPTGPLVNTEFYPGWFTLWQGSHSVTNTSELAKTLEYMLNLGANVDFYVYFGGTNFGFWSGETSSM